MKHLATAAFEAQSVSQSVGWQMMLIQTLFRRRQSTSGEK